MSDPSRPSVATRRPRGFSLLEMLVVLIVQRIVALAIPIITITMGLAVAGIVGALLTALLSLNDLAV